MDPAQPPETRCRPTNVAQAVDGTTGFHGWLVPRQRTPSTGHESPETRSGSTAVLPYVGSETSHRTRELRAWMLALPLDLAALLAPLLWTTQYWKGAVFTAGLTITIFATGGLYTGRRHVSLLDELPTLGGRLLAAAAAVAIIAAERHDSVTYVAGLMRTVAISAGLVIVSRGASRTAIILARRKRWVEHGAIIVGNGPIAIELARLLRRYPQYGLRFVGFAVAAPVQPGAEGAAAVLGRLDEIETTIRHTGADIIIIADEECPESKLLEMVRRPACEACDLWVVPRLRELRSHGGGMSDHIGAIPVTHMRRATLSGPQWLVKRASDILFSIVALVLLSPIMLLCAVATRIESGPGIFFHQRRIGRHGIPFDVIKFRSMRPENEQESQTNWSVANDPRIGPVGRFLRRTSLDELPQLWNILRGDMTVVGPRPERPFFADQFSAADPLYAMRHRVPVGLTGLAQVSGLRGDTPISDRARFDNYYIEHWSLWLDVKVILRTIVEVLRGAGQ